MLLVEILNAGVRGDMIPAVIHRDGISILVEHAVAVACDLRSKLSFECIMMSPRIETTKDFCYE